MLHIPGKFCGGKYSATDIHVLYFHFFYSSAPFILQLATPILWNSVLWTDYPLNIGYMYCIFQLAESFKLAEIDRINV